MTTFASYGSLPRPFIQPRFPDWILGGYLLLLGALQATPYWYVSTWFAYATFFIVALSLHPRNLPKAPEFWLMLALPAWAWVVGFASPHRPMALGAAFYLTQIYGLAVVLFWRAGSVAHARFFSWMLVLGALAFAVPSLAVAGASLEGGERSVGVGMHENSFGLWMLYLVLAACLAWPRNAFGRFFIVGCVVAASVAIAASGSRQAGAGVLILLVSYFVLEYVRFAKANLRLLVPMLLAVIAVPAFIVLMFPESPLVQRFSTLIGGGSLGDSDSYRLYLMSVAWNLFLEHPFWGVGFGTFRMYEFSTVYSHTAHLELLASGGVIAFALYYGIIGLIWFRLTRMISIWRANDEIRRLINRVRAVIIVIVSLGFVSPVHHHKAAVFLLVLATGLSVALRSAVSARPAHA